jgi:hypothetical protein
MLMDNPALFEEAATDLVPHLAHKIAISADGGDAAPDRVAIHCEDCNKCLIELLDEPCVAEHPDPQRVVYEGHYDDGRDVCYVEVSRPNKSPYPLQERQDIINHSPTGIAWGYGGSGPAQCAFAILMDYFQSEAAARALYQRFKFKVIAALPQNSRWTLNGSQIESALGPIRLDKSENLYR